MSNVRMKVYLRPNNKSHVDIHEGDNYRIFSPGEEPFTDVTFSEGNYVRIETEESGLFISRYRDNERQEKKPITESCTIICNPLIMLLTPSENNIISTIYREFGHLRNVTIEDSKESIPQGYRIEVDARVHSGIGKVMIHVIIDRHTFKTDLMSVMIQRIKGATQQPVHTWMQKLGVDGIYNNYARKSL